MSIQKSNPPSLISFILKFMRLQKGRFICIFLFSLVWTLDATVWPYLLRSVVDTFGYYDLDRKSAWPILQHLLSYMAILWLVVETGFRSRGFLQARAFPQLEANMRMALFEHVQHHSPQYFKSNFSGALSNKVNDIGLQATNLLESILIFFPTFTICLVSVALFFQIHLVFASILLIYLILHFSTSCLFIKKCSAYSNIHGEARSSLVGKIVDSLSNYFAVNLFFRFKFEKERILDSQREEQEKNYKARRYVSLMFLFLSCIFFSGVFALSIFTMLYWTKGNISTGEVVQIFNTTWNVAFSLWFMSERLPSFFQSIGIATQALSVLKDPQDVFDHPKSKDLVIEKGEITFENVSFRYENKQIFSEKNVTIRGKERVGLVGCSGAGKSTFVNLILGFYPIEKGRILIDGQDIAYLTKESLRTQIALIPQDTTLFHRSLLENIGYGNLNASEDEIKQAAKLSHCDEFIQKIPEEYSSLVGERGAKLSGGERQRIAIARAVLSKAPILIFDEATSALDSLTEQYIQESLDELTQNRTTIVIAHRLSTLTKMDRILVFDEGKIVEDGSHSDLLKKQGHYAHMWNMQVGGFLIDSPRPQP